MVETRKVRYHIIVCCNVRIQLKIKKRASSPVDDHLDKPTKKSRTTVKPKKAVKNLGTCSMDKKQIGDSVKAALALSKYALNRTVISASHQPPST